MANVNVSTTVSNITVSADDVTFNVSTTNNTITVGEVVGIVPVNAVQDLGNIAGAVSINVAEGVVVKGLLTGDITDITFTNFLQGQTVQLLLTQDANGDRILNTSTNFGDWRFVGDYTTLDPAANANSIITIVYDGSIYNASLVRFDGENPLQNITTDLLPEGNVNLYYTTARSRSAISNAYPVLYNTGTGVIDIDAAALFSGKTTDDLAEGNTNLYFTTDRANSAVNTYFGDAANGPFTINGNLTVVGNIDYVNVEDLLVNDQSITLNYGNVLQDAYIYIDRTGLTNAHLRWNETDDRWEISDGSTTYIVPRSTTDLAEGANLYYTDARARAAISATGNIIYDANTGVISEQLTTTDIDEGDNLYYTDARVEAYLSGNTSTINADTIQANAFIGGTFSGEGSDLTDVRAKTVELTVKNVSGANIAKGYPLHVTGATGGGTPEVVLADAGNAQLMPAQYIAGEDLAIGAEGRGIVTGEIRGIDTATPGFQVGEVIYVAVGGGYANVAPSGEGNIIQNLGIVSRIDATNGGGEIFGAGRGAATPALDQGNIFIGDAQNNSSTATLDTSIVPEGTNLYYTDARANAAMDAYLTSITANVDSVNGQTGVVVLDTDDIAEGVANLYYTNARVQAYVVDAGLDFNAEKVDDRVANLLQTSGNLTFTYDDGANTLTLSQSLTTTDIAEGANLYYTTDRANSAIAAYDGDMLNVDDIVANTVTTANDITANTFVYAEQQSNTTIGGIKALNGGSTISSFNNEVPFVNQETGFLAVQAGDDAANVFSIPRMAMVKLPAVDTFTKTNIEELGQSGGAFDDVQYAMGPGAFAGILDSKINKRRSIAIPNFGISYLASAEGATVHATGAVLFLTDNSNTIVQSSQSYGLAAGQPAFTTAPMSNGIIAFRTLQTDIAGDLPTEFAYTEATSFANSTVAYIDSKFNIGREDDANLSYSFPKTPGSDGQVLQLDANSDLQWAYPTSDALGNLITITSETSPTDPSEYQIDFEAPIEHSVPGVTIINSAGTINFNGYQNYVQYDIATLPAGNIEINVADIKGTNRRGADGTNLGGVYYLGIRNLSGNSQTISTGNTDNTFSYVASAGTSTLVKVVHIRQLLFATQEV